MFVRDGQLQLMTVDNALGGNQQCMGDLAAASGDYYYELRFWSTSRVSFAGKCALGISQPSASLSTGVGNETLSYGWWPYDGTIRNNNAAIQSGLAVQPERITLGCYLTLSPTIANLAFALNGSLFGSVIALPLGKIWLPSITIGGDAQADLMAELNLGQFLFDNPLNRAGWRRLAPGQANLYLSLATEAFMSAHTDTPADQPYSPDIIDPTGFSIRRAPLAWPHRSDPTDRAPAPSAYAPLLLKNDKGQYNALVAATSKDGIVTLDTLDAPPMSQGSLTTATRMFTANIDEVTKPSVNTVQVSLKDNVARMDIAMQTHRVWAHYDDSAAGKMVPWGIGAMRCFAPLSADVANLLYILGDAPFSNLQLVMDQGAPLDPNTPQYTGAGSGKQLQLLQPNNGGIRVDGSTVGPQYVSGVVDVLNGDGAFTTWVSGVPHGWTKAANPPFQALVVANGSITQRNFSAAHPSALQMISTVNYFPSGVGFYYGYPLPYATIILKAGKGYRISFKLLECIGNYTQNFGFAILAGFADSPLYWITDFHQPLKDAGTYGYEFTVPPASGDQQMSLVCISGFFAGNPPTTFSCSCTVDDIIVEELGHYTSAPLIGSLTMLNDALLDVLVTHQGEDPAILSSADALALHAKTVSTAFPQGYVWGIRYFDVPNVASVIQEMLDVYGAVFFTDAFNVFRLRQLIAPEDGTPIALFNKGNIKLENPDDFTDEFDPALALTMLFGARRDWDPYDGGDLVSDPAIVDSDRRTQLTETSQFHVKSTVEPSAEYNSARANPRFHTLHDDPDACLIEGDRVNRIWAPRMIAGLLTSGKRRIVKFTVGYSGLALGMAPLTVQPQQLYYGDVVTIDVPEKGYNATPATVLSTELFPFKHEITIEALV